MNNFQKGQILTIELVPKSSWFKNLRSELPPKEWDLLRRWCYKESKYRCSICGGKGSKHPVECHEIWEYEPITKINRVYLQKLIGIEALCPRCHEVKHIGYAKHRGRFQKALNHLMKVNKITKTSALRHVQEAFRIYRNRSNRSWDVSIDWAVKKCEELKGVKNAVS